MTTLTSAIYLKRSNLGIIIHLRRTNLVKMAISKMQHGGGVKRRNVAPNIQRIIVDFEYLLETIHKYCIVDQEIASLRAYQSFNTAATILILYEDLLSKSGIIRKGLESFLDYDIG